MKLFHGDCLDILKTLEENSIDSIVTDPPYGLSFMGKKWDYEVPAVEMWKEAFSVLKPGAHLLSFFGTKTYHRGVVNIEDAGFEIRDQVGWLYGSGFPKSHNIGNGWGTALKPAWEPIVVARKPLSEKTVAENVLKWGTGAVNINGCRVEKHNGDRETYGVSGDEESSTGNANTQCYGKFNRIEYKPHSEGRWPANVIHDGSDEVLEEFAKFGVSKSGKDKGKRGKGGIWQPSDGTPCGPQYGDEGTPARFFYSAKANKKDRDEGLEHLDEKKWIQWQTKNGTSGEASNLSADRNTAYRNTHPTVKPTSLMRYLCRLITPPKGIVLDPFMGSGSTGKAALLENFDFIGIEKEEEYIIIAKARIETINTLSIENFI